MKLAFNEKTYIVNRLTLSFNLKNIYGFDEINIGKQNMGEKTLCTNSIPKISINHSITDTLNDSKLREAFKEFTKKDCSYDNFYLLEQVEKYKKLTSPEKRFQLGNDICFNTLNIKGRRSVNLPEKMIQKVQQEFEKKENPPTDLFDDLFLEIMNSLLDSHNRFLDTFSKCTNQ